MKNILILADGMVAEEFISKINSKRVADNRYTVIKSNDLKLPPKLQNQIEIVEIDPTSYAKMRRLFIKQDFSMVFIILDRVDDAGESLKIIRRIDKRVRVVLLDMWGAFDKFKQGSNTVIFNVKEMLSNQLYNHLPNVPIVARNVGLGEGEIMEVLVPFGSTFAYRHIGSIAQIKWKIVAIYRNNKLIMPNNATMIKPQDTLLIVGRPQVLINIYRQINNRAGMFPEPFGSNLYLLIDMEKDEKAVINYIEDAIYFLENLQENRSLFVKIVNPTSFDVLTKIKLFESKRVNVYIDYSESEVYQKLAYDIEEFDIGLILLSKESLKNKKTYQEIYEQKKMVYIFGDTKTKNIEKSVITITADEEEMESISSIGFYISETLGLKFLLCDFDPEGDFESKKRIKEHYETLSHIFQYSISIEQKQVNPVRELKKMKNILYIAPFDNTLLGKWFFIPYLSTSIKRYIIDYIPHPKLLVPIEV